MSESWGVSRTIALALSGMDLNIVHRATLRAMLPKGAIRRGGVTRHLTALQKGGIGTRNETSDKFQKALWGLERRGWIKRGTEYVLVMDHRALFDYALELEPPRQRLLFIEDAIEQVNSDLRAEMVDAAVEQRRRELLALKRLMENGFGSNWSGRGSVRLMPRGGVF